MKAGYPYTLRETCFYVFLFSLDEPGSLGSFELIATILPELSHCRCHFRQYLHVNLLDARYSVTWRNLL